MKNFICTRYQKQTCNCPGSKASFNPALCESHKIYSQIIKKPLSYDDDEVLKFAAWATNLTASPFSYTRRSGWVVRKVNPELSAKKLIASKYHKLFETHRTASDDEVWEFYRTYYQLLHQSAHKEQSIKLAKFLFRKQIRAYHKHGSSRRQWIKSGELKEVFTDQEVVALYFATI